MGVLLFPERWTRARMEQLTKASTRPRTMREQKPPRTWNQRTPVTRERASPRPLQLLDPVTRELGILEHEHDFLVARSGSPWLFVALLSFSVARSGFSGKVRKGNGGSLLFFSRSGFQCLDSGFWKRNVAFSGSEWLDCGFQWLGVCFF